MGRSRRVHISVFLLLLAMQLACALTSTGDATWPSDANGVTDVNGAAISVTGADSAINATVLLGGDDAPLDVNCDDFIDLRQEMLAFAQTASSYDLSIRFQADAAFLQRLERCETAAMQAETNGQSILDYLLSMYGYEIGSE
ncbi:MAG: hypothetical protein PVF49_13720 [Anaerolineales bacterium]